MEGVLGGKQEGMETVGGGSRDLKAVGTVGLGARQLWGQEMGEWRFTVDVPLACWRRSGLLGLEEGLIASHGM